MDSKTIFMDSLIDLEVWVINEAFSLLNSCARVAQDLHFVMAIDLVVLFSYVTIFDSHDAL